MFALTPLLIVLPPRCLLTLFHQRLTPSLLLAVGNPLVHLLLTNLFDRLFEVFVDGGKRLEHPTAVEVVLDQFHRVVGSLADHLADRAEVGVFHV